MQVLVLELLGVRSLHDSSSDLCIEFIKRDTHAFLLHVTKTETKTKQESPQVMSEYFQYGNVKNLKRLLIDGFTFR